MYIPWSETSGISDSVDSDKILRTFSARCDTALESRNFCGLGYLEKVSEHDQEIPQSQTADNPVAPRGRAAQPSRDTRKTN